MLYGRKELTRRCQEVLDRLTLPRPFSLEAFCRQLSQSRGRPLHLHALPGEVATAGACGLWLATDTDDHIFYEPQTTKPHQEHIVLHELAHLLFNHHTLGGADGSATAGLLPDLDPTLIRRLFARTGYTTVQEQEAEMLASLLKASALRDRGTRPSGVLGELQAGLGVGEPYEGEANRRGE
ncbi:hypothetical protein ACFYMW_10200 [Streptomyces sp. NPDC006692]|uniref:hypothetical protein n=1 Tax=unclassified Streptomyces TaxID=2593676 RepID=UPI0036996807